MQRVVKRIINLILACIVLLTTLSGCSGRTIVITTGFDNDELMRINDKTCYLPEMMLYLTTVQNQYEEVYGPEIWEQSQDGVTMEQKIKDMVLAKIAQIKVMNLMAESYGLSLSEIENNVVSDAAQVFYDSLTAKERGLIGVNDTDVYNIYREYALANKVYDYVIRDINPEISDDEARTITVQQILIKTYDLDGEGKKIDYSDRAMEEAYSRAVYVRDLLSVGDSSFESIAAKYNEGDELSYTFQRGEMPAEFEEAAFSLDKDEISDVVKTEFGYHIIKCISDFDLEETQKNKIEILAKRKEEVFDKTYDDFLTTLTKTLNEKLYDSIIMIHDPEVTTDTFFDVGF